jgi:hypothetical protein
MPKGSKKVKQRKGRIIPYSNRKRTSKEGRKAQLHWTRNKFHPNWLKYNFISDRIRIVKHHLFLYQYWSEFDGDNYTLGKDSLEKELIILIDQQRQLLN